MTHPITVFVARKIVTMNPSNPEGTHVAVRDGKVLGVGTLQEVAGWGSTRSTPRSPTRCWCQG